VKATVLILAIAGLNTALAMTQAVAADVYCPFHYLGPNGTGHDYYAWLHSPDTDCVNKTMYYYYHDTAYDFRFCEDGNCLPASAEDGNTPRKKAGETKKAKTDSTDGLLQRPIPRNTTHEQTLEITQNESMGIKALGEALPYKIKTSCTGEEPRYKHILVYYYTIDYARVGRQTIVCMAFETEPDESDPELDAGLKRWAARQSGTSVEVSAEDRIDLRFGNHMSVCFIASPLSEWFCE